VLVVTISDQNKETARLAGSRRLFDPVLFNDPDVCSTTVDTVDARRQCKLRLDW
jgi:hypothetical protein